MDILLTVVFVLGLISVTCWVSFLSLAHASFDSKPEEVWEGFSKKEVMFRICTTVTWSAFYYLS